MAFFLYFSLLAAFLLSSSSPLASAQTSTVHLPINSSLSWTNSNDSLATYTIRRRIVLRVVLLARANPGNYGSTLSFAAGFYCDRRIGDGCILGVMILDSPSGGTLSADRAPKVVWMANRDRPVKDNSTLRLDPGRGLVLQDYDGASVWSSAANASTTVRSMSLKHSGNLVLLDQRGTRTWQSSCHPVDTLLADQVLHRTQKLVSSISETNSRRGQFFLSLTQSSITAYVRYKSPVAYFSLEPQGEPVRNANLSHAQFSRRNISFFYSNEGHNCTVRTRVTSQLSSPVQILRLDHDGGLRVYTWDSIQGWRGQQTIISLGVSDQCQVPLACGKYGVCTRGGCSCPIATDKQQHFSPAYPNSPNRGCSFVRAYSSRSSVKPRYHHQLVDFGSLWYFGYFDPTAAVTGLTELGACRSACKGNSSCKAAFFTYENKTSQGLCYLPTEVLSIRGEPINGKRSRAFIKVLTLIIKPPPKKSSVQQRSTISPLSTKIWKASAFIVSILVSAIVFWVILWKLRLSKCKKKDNFDRVSGATTRFSYKELCAATGKFSTTLGRGGFGTVFKGSLQDGTAIAAKRLDNIEQGADEFVREMKTMGSIHHRNLVKLIGFCADESNRLLVYEYMSNGSLDKWIFRKDVKEALDWDTRRKIIVNVAKGLAYLHEECTQKIAHLDVKPHNILLDEGLNAKISDFGLARFIDRSQSGVFTGMRGTLGYLAPEWQHSRITEKADIYSFGIVILEVVSGRRNFDYSDENPDMHLLLSVLERKARDDQVMDIVDESIVDRDRHKEDIVKMIRIGAWCLNRDQYKRPIMSTVVKLLEGAMEVEHLIDFRFAQHVLILSDSTTEASSECSSKCSSC